MSEVPLYREELKTVRVVLQQRGQVRVVEALPCPPARILLSCLSVAGVGLRASGFGFRGSGVGFRVSGYGARAAPRVSFWGSGFGVGCRPPPHRASWREQRCIAGCAMAADWGKIGERHVSEMVMCILSGLSALV